MNTTLLKVLISVFVIAHLVGNMWHGAAHETLEIDLPDLKNGFVYVVVLATPLIGLGLLWFNREVIACWLVGLSMLGSVLFSVYHHYVWVSEDNVDYLPEGTPEAHAHFANSAELIALLALAAALLGFYAAGRLAKQH
ncbi:MAG: hypothetical protein AB8B48_16165 [Pseudomonadales bacterium]